MQPLEKTLRNRLERTVKDARDIAENAARATLDQLGVGEATPFDHLSDKDRELRRKLRVHGRQLGDSLDDGKMQTTDRLMEEIAYEHWHRMLFARFLAENNLLMYPDPDDPVAVTLEECQDLAADEGAANGWELAARFAARMLPQIFRPDSPVFQLTFPPEYQQKLERLVADLPPEVFTASDSLGWVYQFWQAKKKDEVNGSEVKIGARELPAVTQLFTEPYMVSFLLDNSLGAWWAARRLNEADLKSAADEEELRRKAAIQGVPLEYLRFVQPEDGARTPAAGTFDAWPKKLGALKVLDPCCGSGHFLVAAFLMLVPMRMEREGLSITEAVDLVLTENIHGLELDPRCVELAAFALALTAWRYPGSGGYRQLPKLNVACSGLSVGTSRLEWEKLANGNSKLRVALAGLYEEFKNAPTLGSLIDPMRNAVAKLVEWDGLSEAVGKAFQKDREDEEREIGVVAQGLSKAAHLLAGKYQLIVTNVPYLTRGKQDEILRDFCGKHYPEAKNDLATVFLDRCLELCAEGGTSSIVLPQNWLFLTSYRKFREKLLKHEIWHLIARLGPGAFETVSGEVVKAILIALSRGHAKETSGFKRRDPASAFIRGLEISELRTASEKAVGLLSGEVISVGQAKQLENPDSIIALEVLSSDGLLKDYVHYSNGVQAGDSTCFVFFFWEVEDKEIWSRMQTPVNTSREYGGLDSLLRWESGNGMFWNYVTERLGDGGQRAWIRGTEYQCHKGIAVSATSKINAVLYTGNFWNDSILVLTPHKEGDVLPILVFCGSNRFEVEVRKIDQKLNVRSAITKVPFDLAHWTKVAEAKYPHGLPKPYSDDPTQWIFHGHPCGTVVWNEERKRLEAASTLRTEATVLQVAVARLLGYRWPAEQDAEMELADEQREWVSRCNELLSFADEDGIVCIPPVRGEASAADRLLNLLAAAYGDAWSNDILAQLLKSADHAGKTLETWLREKFFAQHCKLFQHRPFIWHIWDGLRDGFSALVNYHKLHYKTFEALIYTYLGDWISTQKDAITKGVDGAQEKLAAAEILKKKLELVLEGEAPYDIFIRWKPLSKQPIGWNPDLNDGVRLNIRPFMTAGVLRFNKKPQLNISWDKDRGKDVPSAPWYHLFNGDRINDHHLSPQEKRAARKEAAN